MSSVEAVLKDQAALALINDDSDAPESRYRELIDSLPAPVYATDADGLITYFNRAAADLAGREPKLGVDRWSIIWRLYEADGSPLPLNECPMAIAIRERRPVRGIEVVAERPDGVRIPLLPHPTPIFDDAGRLVGAINMLIDISERHSVISQVEASEARYRGIFEGARVALWDEDFSPVIDWFDTLRASGVKDLRAYFESNPDELAAAVSRIHVRDVNNYALELLDAESKEELLGSLGRVFVPEAQNLFLDEMVALWEGKHRFEGEALVRTLKGRPTNILLTVTWNGSRCERGLVSIIDMSRQKATEHRLEAVNRIATALSSDLDLERIVQTVTDSATELSGARFGAFFYNLADSKGERYLLYTLSGTPREAFDKFGMPRNTKLFDATFRGSGIVRSDDIRKDPRYGHNPPHHGMPKGHLPVVSYLAVPVVSRSGEVIGGLFFGHDQPGVFTEDVERAVAGIAAHAAIAVDNASLFRAAQAELEWRKRANEAQHRLGLIVESSEDAIISKDLNGIIVSWNAGAEKLFGYTADEVIGQPVTMLIPEDHLDEEPSILSRIRRGEPVEHYDTVRRRKDGSRIDISLSVSPIIDPDGNIVGASKIARDISERKKAANALAKRVDEQATLYQFTNRLHRAQSLADVYDSTFDAISRGLGCERASILLFDEGGVMRFVASRGISEEYRAAVEGHSPWTADVRDPQPICIGDIETSDLSASLKATIHKEGIAAVSFIPLVVKGKLVGKFMTYYSEPHEFLDEERDLALTIARQLGFSIDRMRAEESLRESERRLEQALTAGQMGAWEWNLTTGRVIWSPGLQRIHGLEPGSFGGTFDDFKRDIHPEDLDQVLTSVEEAVANDGDYHVTYRMKHPDGTTRWLEAFGSFIHDTENNTRRIAGICTDITERKESEAQRDLLVAELSHRVKNTLATVISIARQSFSRTQNVDEAVSSFDARVRALAQTHTRLAEASWSGVPFETMLLDEIAPYRRDDGSNIRYSGPRIRLNPRAALTLGLAIHELATNAAKHGALSTKQGAVDISWTLDSENRLNIHWTEIGGPPVKPPARSGFGRLLLERALASDLRGDVHLDFQRSGLTCSIAFPLDDDGSYIH